VPWLFNEKFGGKERKQRNIIFVKFKKRNEKLKTL
jgi:hypothetical protein